MFRILLTDASYKHCIAMQRHIRRCLTDVQLVGHDNSKWPTCKYYGYLDSIITDVTLAELLVSEHFDMIIPVGAKSVATVSELCPHLAVLPAMTAIDTCFDKYATMMLADRIGVPRPKSEVIKNLEDLHSSTISYPSVIKPACEFEAKGVTYAYDEKQRTDQVSRWLAVMPASAHHGVLVQEYIKGSGAGFFALFDHGTPLRVFMHRRLREYPITGGASTAARAYYNETLKDYGLRLLQSLRWHGVAMVEFKYDEDANRFVLIEINPKFWGSLELALESGMNFGADVVRLFRGEVLNYSEEYDHELHFYWPLDGDLLSLIRTRSLGKLRDYRAGRAATNLGYSRVADCFGVMQTLAKLLKGK